MSYPPPPAKIPRSTGRNKKEDQAKVENKGTRKVLRQEDDDDDDDDEEEEEEEERGEERGEEEKEEEEEERVEGHLRT